VPSSSGSVPGKRLQQTQADVDEVNTIIGLSRPRLFIQVSQTHTLDTLDQSIIIIIIIKQENNYSDVKQLIAVARALYKIKLKTHMLIVQ